MLERENRRHKKRKRRDSLFADDTAKFPVCTVLTNLYIKGIVSRDGG
jgi:hypothetical protein